MDYKRIHNDGTPFSFQENKAASTEEQTSKISQSLINMMLSLFK